PQQPWRHQPPQQPWGQQPPQQPWGQQPPQQPWGQQPPQQPQKSKVEEDKSEQVPDTSENHLNEEVDGTDEE
ncbi:MAG: hypothetical protein ACW98K_11055, partial [Candidatus Kariarchaeaceae archaeon]